VILQCLHCKEIYVAQPYRAIRGYYEDIKHGKVQGRRIGNRTTTVVPALCEACGGKVRQDDTDYLAEKGSLL
jgi:predicted Zn-ribbon and HTH transcriptional regulator